MKTKLLYQNLSLSRECRCFGQTLVPEGTGTALLLGDTDGQRAARAAEKLARAGIVLTLALNLGWNEARRLCIRNEGRCSLHRFPFPEENPEGNAPAAVWFYLSLKEEPDSAEEMICLYNGLLSFKGSGEEGPALEAYLGKQAAAALLRAVLAVQAHSDAPEEPCDVDKLCGAVDFPALRTAFLRKWMKLHPLSNEPSIPDGPASPHPQGGR